MIVFPDHRVAGKQTIPLITVSAAGLLLLVLVLDLFSAISWPLPDPIDLALSVLFLVAVGGPAEFALGRMVFAVAMLISALAAVGLPMVLLETRPTGLEWVPLAVTAVCGLTMGLFRSWRLRPLYLVSGWPGRICYPAYAPVLVWMGVHALVSWQDASYGRVFLVHLQCAAAGFLVGMTMNALSLIQPSLFTSEYARRVIRKGLSDVEDLIREHRLPRARRLLKQLTSLDPDDMDLKRALYAVWKYRPRASEFHAAAAALLDQQETDSATHQAVEEIFRDYMAVTQGKPKLPAGLHLSLSRRFARNHNVEDAANIVNVFLQRRIQHESLPETILTLAECYVLTDRPAKAVHYAETLVALFPESQEVNAARSMLVRLSRLLS